MPRKDINYSNTIIYQITCKNKNVSDMYISYTTNLTQRKYKHKRESLDLSVKSRLYDSIRKNGGWENWNCVILEECVCKNEYLAKERMNFYILKNKPKLNDENLDDLLFQYEALNSSIYENIENDESIENVEIRLMPMIKKTENMFANVKKPTLTVQVIINIRRRVYNFNIGIRTIFR